jgi:hypothetical protein
MIIKNIGIMGPPVSGKTTTLIKLSKAHKTEPIKDLYLDEQGMKLNHIIHWKFINKEYNLNFYTLPGPVVYAHEMYPFILSMSDIVIYYFHYEMESKYAYEHEIDYLGRHACVAKRLNKLWTDIPWVFVINKKMFIENENYQVFQLPTKISAIYRPTFEILEDLRDNVIYADTYKGIGIDLIWKRIWDILSIE